MGGLGACEAVRRLVPDIRGRRHASSPVLFAAPGKPTSISVCEHLFAEMPAPLGAPRRRLPAAGPRFWRLSAFPKDPQASPPLRSSGPLSIGQSQRLRTISELLAAGPIACGRDPGTARAREVRFPTPAGAAPCSTILTPHDSAPDKQDKCEYIFSQYCPVNLRGIGEKANSGAAYRMTKGVSDLN